MIAASRFCVGLVSCLAVSLACGFPARQQTPPSEAVPTTVATDITRSTATLASNEAATPMLPLVPTGTSVAPPATPVREDQFRTVTNDAGSIAVTIPSAWADVRSLPWTNERNAVTGHKVVASSDVEAFLRWEADGVAISVSRNLGMGYIQLLDADYAVFRQLAPNPVHVYDDFENSLHRGKFFNLLLCGGVQGCFLRVFSVVPQSDVPAYVAEILIYDDLPYATGAIDDSIMRFEVFSDQLP